MLSMAANVISKLTKESDGKLAQGENLIKRTLGLSDKGIPIGREDEPAGYLRWTASPNSICNTGTIGGGDGDGLKWIEFIWSEPAAIEECKWEGIRWRFYSNGLVCFDARMSNESATLDNGDVQGHRIELREKNGLLLGVWITGFFVRRSLPARGFAASFQDEHLPLKLHFDEIAETQPGACICI
ncbi:MAG: hypothetical protein AB8B58_03465 [Roseobacter sp.]